MRVGPWGIMGRVLELAVKSIEGVDLSTVEVDASTPRYEFALVDDEIEAIVGGAPPGRVVDAVRRSAAACARYGTEWTGWSYRELHQQLFNPWRRVSLYAYKEHGRLYWLFEQEVKR